MECEVCGSETEKLVEVLLEGARVLVCPNCAQLGIAVKKSSFATEKKSTFFYKPTHSLNTGPEVVADLGVQVMKARQRAGLKREELAKKIFEKESVLHRIESGHFVPGDRLIRKLEKELGLKLTEIGE